ncbi:MAG: histidine--tRNA ligase [Chloroflexota bacterium]|nr:MAG: histidine--tRNA ligase [Chloroflexota bacterium]
MKKRVERLRGMHDILPEAYQHRRWLTDSLSTFLAQAGYVTVDTPMLEHSDLFLTSFGQELWQNLYAFRLHHRDLCLRPEYTASICRLYLDHYQQQHLPLRFQYAGPIFRYEAPGRNRYRQHTQLGVELFGGQAVAADAEIVQLACDVLQKLHITQYRLELGHIGVASGFIQRLRLDEQAARLLLSLMEQISRSEEGERTAQARLGISISFGDDTVRDEVVERFLWKVGRSEQRRQILHALEFMRALHALSGSPPLVFDELRALLASYELDAEPLTELEQLVAVVEQCGVPQQQIVLNLSLGRGVSYYTGLVFEIHARDEDGFDAQLCGGGRYDHLVRAVGGNRDINACGFAFGIERLLSLIDRSDLPSNESTRALVIPVSQSDVPYALQVARSTRLQGLWTEVDVSGHGVGAGLKIATRKQIALAIIVGESEQRTQRVTLKDLQTGEERVLAVDTLAENIAHKEQWQ